MQKRNLQWTESPSLLDYQPLPEEIAGYTYLDDERIRKPKGKKIRKMRIKYDR